MKIFWVLTIFEYKKILQRKTVWITMGVLIIMMLLVSCMTVLTSQFNTAEGEVISGYEIVQRNREAEKLMEGKKIDDFLLQEAQSDSGDFTDGLFSMMYSILRQELLSDREEPVTAKEFYTKRETVLQQNRAENYLSEGETKYLKSQEEKVKIPFQYQYAGGYQSMGTALYSVVVMQILLCAICISGIFSEEHVRKTDQLILSTRFGRKISYAAKITVGLTYSLFSTIILIIVAAVPTFIIYGTEGFGAQIQMLLPGTSWSLNAGEMVLILVGICLVSALLNSAAAMFLSELLKGSVQTIAIMVGVMLLALFLNIPGQYRILAQIWESIPMKMMVGGTFGPKLFPFFGTYLTAWQLVPVIYLVIVTAVSFIGRRLYCNYQVGAR